MDLADSLFSSVFREDQLSSSGEAENGLEKSPVTDTPSVTVSKEILLLTREVLIEAQKSDLTWLNVLPQLSMMLVGVQVSSIFLLRMEC